MHNVNSIYWKILFLQNGNEWIKFELNNTTRLKIFPITSSGIKQSMVFKVATSISEYLLILELLV